MNLAQRNVKFDLNIFAQTEGTEVGLFDQCIRLTYPNDIALEELTINNDGKLKGQSDLFIHHEAEQEDSELLLEAKQRKYNPSNYSENSLSEYYSANAKQARGYLECKTPLFNNTNYYGVIIIDWVRDECYLAEPHSDILLNKNSISVFISLTNDGTSGLFVHGKIFEK